MKQYSKLLRNTILAWLVGALITSFFIYQEGYRNFDKLYKVEINRILDAFNKSIPLQEIEVSKYQYVKTLELLPVNESQEKITEFFEGKGVAKELEYHIRPYYKNQGLEGYIRISYDLHNNISIYKILILYNIFLAIMFLIIIAILLYIKRIILNPFQEMVDMPYDLSKGHYKFGLKENKNRFFGKFLWGLDLLRQTLDSHQKKELELQKEKKTMILSISHDIKTPLSSIKLYSKAIYDNLYQTEEKKREAAKLIDEKASQIEGFVSEIIANSTKDIIDIQVNVDEFYLSQLMEQVLRAYKEKLLLLKIEFILDYYEEILLKGDLDRVVEVMENILENAIKYGDGRKIRIHFEEEDYCKLIRITNTGKPIPDTEFIHMFESFWRGSNAHNQPGTGLGLYICKKILLKMEGDIFAKSTENTMEFIVVIRYS